MKPPLEITGGQREILLALLRKHVPGVKVWAYGSRVKGTAHAGSDLDLVVFATPAIRARFSELRDALAESNLPFTVSLHLWDEEPEYFQNIIRGGYVVVQEGAGK